MSVASTNQLAVVGMCHELEAEALDAVRMEGAGVYDSSTKSDEKMRNTWRCRTCTSGTHPPLNSSGDWRSSADESESLGASNAKT